MRHDYDFPPDWEARTDEEKSRWMTQDRALSNGPDCDCDREHDAS